MKEPITAATQNRFLRERGRREQTLLRSSFRQIQQFVLSSFVLVMEQSAKKTGEKP